MEYCVFNRQVVSDSLWPHGLQHTRLPCPSASSGVCPRSCSEHQWHHPTISSSVTFLCFCLQSFPASASLPVSWLFTSGGQSIGASASVSVLPVSIQGWFTSRLTGLISLLSKGLSSTTVRKHNFYSTQHSQLYMTTGKTIDLAIQTFVSKVMSLLLNILSRFFIAYLSGSNRLLFHGCSHHLQWF